MVKKLKRYFSLLLSISMIMSQANFSAFANVIYIATRGNAEYSISTASNSDAEKQISSDSNSLFSKSPKMARLLPDTLEVTDLQLISVTDGTPDWDEMDGGPNNQIVRTFDTVTYNLRMAIQEPEEPTPKPYSDEIQFMTRIRNVEEGALFFQTETMGWLEGAETKYNKEKNELVLTGRMKVDSDENSAFWQDLAVIIKVGDMDKGESFSPEFYAWIDGQSEKKCINDSEATKITVYAEEAININLQFDEVGVQNTYDLSLNGNLKEEVFGCMFGLALNVELFSEGNSLKGLKTPNDKISFDIELNVLDKEGNVKEPNAETGLYLPKLWDYHQAVHNEETQGVLGRALVGSINGKDLMPYGKYNATHPDKSVYNSGDLTIVQEGNILHVTINNYEFSPNLVFPVYTQYGNVYSQNSNQGVFSTALIQILVPYEIIDNLALFTIEATAQNFVLGTKNIAQHLEDDIATRQIQNTSGSWNQRITFSHKDEFADTPNSLVVGKRAYSGRTQGDFYAYPGEELYMLGTVMSYVDYQWNGADYLLKFPNSIEVPNLQDIAIYCVSKNPSGAERIFEKFDNPFKEYKISYAAKATGEYWADETEMDNARIDHLVYYDSLDAVKTNKATVLGLLFELRDGKEYNEDFRMTFKIPIKISEQAEINQVYPFTMETMFYQMGVDNAENGMTTKHGLAHIEANTNDPVQYRVQDTFSILRNSSTDKVSRGAWYAQSGYGKYKLYGINFDYIKAVYKDGQVQPGTHVSTYVRDNITYSSVGQFAGSSLLIVGTKTSLEKAIEQIDEKGNPRSVYNLNAGQREVDFVIKPSYQFAVEHLLKDEVDDLIITETLDKGLTYISGSAYQGGEYDVQTEMLIGGIELPPSIYINDDGSQVLTWRINNVKAGEPIEPIHYSCMIGSTGADDDVNNGDILTGKTTITASGDNRPVTLENGKVAISSLQVTTNKSSALMKGVDKNYAELEDEVTYTMKISNNGNIEYENILVRDILPYEGDKRGTDFKGGIIKVKSLKLATESNADGVLYITKKDPSKLDSLKMQYEMTEAWEDWVPYDDEMALDGVTAIAWRGDINAGQVFSAIVETQISCPVTGAVFVNNAEAFTNNHQKLTSIKVRTNVLPRKISGITWFDTDCDGIRETGETLLAGVKVTLLDAEGNAVNDIYDNLVHPFVTGADGVYAFDNLAAGEYQVRFESDTYKLDELLVTVKNSVTAGDEMDSDADGVYDGELLKAAVISGIELPELSEIVEENLDEWHEAHLDAGFHEPESEETEPETTVPETTPSEPETSELETTPSEPETSELETTPSEPETSELETTPSYVDDDDDEPETTPTTVAPPTEAPTEPTLPTESITDIVPETEPLPYVDPEARPEDIPDEVVQVYYERYVNGDIDLDDIPFGVLGAFFEKGYPMAVLPATGDIGGFWTWMMMISLIGLAVTSVIDKKRVR